MSHLQDSLLSAFLRSLSTADAGALLHLLACPACAAKATATLGFPPTGEALALAQRRLGDSADPHARAMFCRDLAKLREAEGRHEEALALFERAASLFEDFAQTEAREILCAAVEQHGAGVTLVQRADLAWIEARITARRGESAAPRLLPEDRD